jgi:hypothetical protein
MRKPQMETKIKKTRRRRCDHCGELKPKEDVTYTINPYEQDVKGITIFQKLCDDCYENLMSDI